MKQIIFLFVFLLFTGSYSALAKGRVYINVGEASVKKSLLALPKFNPKGANTAQSKKVGAEIYEVLKQDLEVTFLFTFIDPNAYLEDTSKVGIRPAPAVANGFDFSKWDTISTEFLLRGEYTISGSNVSLEAYLYYVPQARLVFGKKYNANVKQLRGLSHTLADDLMESVTGKKSIFNTKILASIDNGPKTPKEIYMMDWDGHNKSPVTTHKSISISPAWSHDGTKVAYTSYVQHGAVTNPDLFVYDLKTKSKKLVSAKRGMNSGAAFLQDGQHMLLTVTKGKSPDIYRMTIDGKNPVNITKGPYGAMNVEPAISPDGNTIAFSSSRGGNIRLYTMDSNGGNVKLISSVGRYNATPTWSPDGEKIAFAGLDKKKGKFDIFIIDKDGRNLKRLTSARKTNGGWANSESPTFSPDGRYIMFVSDRSGKKQLYIVSPDGKNEKRITYDNKNYSKPKWSPFFN